MVSFVESTSGLGDLKLSSCLQPTNRPTDRRPTEKNQQGLRLQANICEAQSKPLVRQGSLNLLDDQRRHQGAQNPLEPTLALKPLWPYSGSPREVWLVPPVCSGSLAGGAQESRTLAGHIASYCFTCNCCKRKDGPQQCTGAVWLNICLLHSRSGTVSRSI